MSNERTVGQAARTPEGWRRLRDLFDAALELSEDERRAFVDRVGEDDAEVGRELESLIRAHERPAAVLESPMLRLERPLAAPDDTARQIGPYRLEGLLGSGGMCSVYLASRADRAYRQQVAVKILRWGLETDDMVRRFRTERQILADLDHPNVTRLLDGGLTDDGRPYLVMELVDGTPIDAYCRRHRLPLEARLRLFRKVCDAVRFAHQNLIVHRDLKPGNILVDDRGEPKLLDFGIAKLLAPGGPPAEATRDGLPMTPAYASPEQLGGAPITTASDVYSLGVVLYELLAGRLPHPRRLEERLEGLAEDREPEPPSLVADGGVEAWRLAGDLDAIVTRALRRQPGERYPSVEQLADDLERFEQGLPVRARAGTLGYRMGKLVRRHKLGVALAAGFLVFLVAVAVVLAAMAARIAHERDLARIERNKAEQVSTFMIGLFEVADPEAARGDDVTVREVLDRGAVSISERLRDQPEVLAAMLHAIGRVYQNLGIHQQAAPLLEEALRLRRELLGAEHPDVLESLGEYAKAKERLGDFAAAATLYRNLLEIQQDVLGEDSPEVAETLLALSRLLRFDGDFGRAEASIRKALDIARRAFGDEHEAVVSAHHALAQVLSDRGDLRGAESEYRAAVDLGRKVVGIDDPLLLPVLKDLAGILADTERIKEAEKTYLEILEIERRIFGEKHPRIAYTLNHLGVLKLESGDLDAAEPLLREGLRMRRELFGEDHLAVAVSSFSLAEVQRRRRRYEQAEELYRRALGIIREGLPPGAPYLAHPLVGLARSRMAHSDFAAAEPMLREALAIRRRALTDGDELILVTAEELRRCLVGLGRTDEAEMVLASTQPSD